MWNGSCLNIHVTLLIYLSLLCSLYCPTRDPSQGEQGMLHSLPSRFGMRTGQRGFAQRNVYEVFPSLLLNCKSPAHPQPFIRFSQSSFGVKIYYKLSGSSAVKIIATVAISNKIIKMSNSYLTFIPFDSWGIQV